MADARSDEKRAEISVTNIGGIEQMALEIEPGVTALVGENATNRTSLVQAIAAGLGTDEYSLKSDSQTGEVTLSVGEQTYKRKFNRENGSIKTVGSPYLDDPTLAELYAVLLRSNGIRQAVRDGRPLRDLLLEPLDTAGIERQITEVVDQRREVDAELDRLDRAAEQLTELRAERERKEQNLDELQAALAEKRDTLAEADAEGAANNEQGEFDEKMAALSDARSERERARTTLENERQRLESLRESYETVTEQRRELSAPDEPEIPRLKERLNQLRDRKQQLDTTISELRQVIRFNNERLSESQSLLTDALGDVDDTSVVDELDPNAATTTCWTCGSTVEPSRIEATVDKLRNIERQNVSDRKEIEQDITDVREKLDDLTTRREECESLDSKIDEFENRIRETEQTVEEFENRVEELDERIETLEKTVASLREPQQDEFLRLQQKVSELEVKTERAEESLEETIAEIEKLESEVSDREHLEQRRERLSEQLTDLRTKVERIESDAVDQFNTHMAALLERLGYDNIDRIWMERRDTDTAEGSNTVSTAEFNLHVARENDSGEVYEDTLTHLSESEREIVGLVVALAGYLVHDVHETVPFMLLDSVEMVDGGRLVDLVTYLEDYVPFLVVVLLPDHAVAFEKQASGESFRAVHV